VAAGKVGGWGLVNDISYCLVRLQCKELCYYRNFVHIWCAVAIRLVFAGSALWVAGVIQCVARMGEGRGCAQGVGVET
jgi:hypothetical protein